MELIGLGPEGQHSLLPEGAVTVTGAHNGVGHLVDDHLATLIWRGVTPQGLIEGEHPAATQEKTLSEHVTAQSAAPLDLDQKVRTASALQAVAHDSVHFL